MKFSDYIKNEIEHLDDELILEAADNRNNYNIPPYLVGTTADTIKNVLSTAACIVLSIVIVIAFILMRNSISQPPADTTADTGTGTGTESVTESETETETETEESEYFEASNEEFEYFVESGIITITRYIGNAENVTIPITIDVYPVYHLGQHTIDDYDNGHGEIVTGIFADSAAKNVTIPGSINEIYSESFLESDQIETITIREGSKRIESGGFAMCTSLREITIPKSMEYIGENAFSDVGALEIVYYLGTEDEWNELIDVSDIDYDFSSINIVFDVPDPNDISVGTTGSFEYTVISGKVIITRYTGNEEVVEIPPYIDSYPVLHLGQYKPADESISPTGIFAGTTAKHITIPHTVERIYNFSFADSPQIESIEIEEGVLYIEDEAFRDCSSLSSLILPKSLLSMGENVFSDSISLKTVYYWGDVVSWNKLMSQTNSASAFAKAKKLFNIPDVSNNSIITDNNYTSGFTTTVVNEVKEYSKQKFPENDIFHGYISSTESFPILLENSGKYSDDEIYIAEYHIVHTLLYGSGEQLFYACSIRSTESFNSPAKIIGIETYVDGVTYDTEYALDFIRSHSGYENVTLITTDSGEIHSSDIEAYNFSRYKGVREIIERYGKLGKVKHTIVALPPISDFDQTTWLLKLYDESKSRYEIYRFSLDTETGEVSNVKKYTNYNDIYDEIKIHQKDNESTDSSTVYESGKIVVYYDKNSDLFIKYKDSGDVILLHNAVTDEDVYNYIEENGMPEEWPIGMYSGSGNISVIDDKFVLFNEYGWECVSGLCVYEVDSRCLIDKGFGKRIYTIRGNRVFINLSSVGYIDLCEGSNYTIVYPEEINSVLWTYDSEEESLPVVISADGRYITAMENWEATKCLKQIVVCNTETNVTCEYFIYNPFSVPITFHYTDDGYIIINGSDALRLYYDPLNGFYGYGSSIEINSNDQYVYRLKLP